MTSNISFRKMLFSEIRQKSYVPIILFVTFLLAIPIPYLMQIHQAVQVPMGEAEKVYVRSMRITETIELFSVNPMILALLLFAAFACAMGSYEYLSSRTKVDFYHSLALRRGRLFRILYVSGWLGGACTYLINLLIAFFGIGLANGLVTAQTIQAMCVGMFWHLVFYTAVYSVIVLAMTLSGRRLIGVLLAVFMLFYGPACAWIAELMALTSFRTYMEPAGLEELFLRLSPITLGAAGIRGGTPITAADWIVLSGFAVLGLIAAWRVFCLRPSEAAGNAYVHPIMNAVIKIATAIPGALGFGLFFAGFGYAGGNGWFVLGAVLGAVLIGGTVEVIQSVDIKALWQNWRSNLILFAGLGALLLIFLADPFGYDRYLPARDRVEAMAFYSDDMMEDVTYTTGLYQDEVRDHGMKEFLIRDCDEIYALAEAGVKALDRKDDALRTSMYFGVDTNEAEEKIPSYEEQGVDVNVLFRVGGRNVYRKYTVPRAMVDMAVDAVSEDTAFRRQINLASFLDTDGFRSITYTDWSLIAEETGEPRRLSKEERQEFLAALRNDFEKMQIRQIRKMDPIGEIELRNDDEMTYEVKTFYVYENYDETIAFLKKMRYRLNESVDQERLAEEIASAVVEWNNQRYAIRETEDIKWLVEHMKRTKWSAANRYEDCCYLDLISADDYSYYIACRWKDAGEAKTFLAGKEIHDNEEETDW